MGHSKLERIRAYLGDTSQIGRLGLATRGHREHTESMEKTLIRPPLHRTRTVTAPRPARCPSRPDYEATAPDFTKGWSFYKGETESTERDTIPARKKA